MCLYRCLLLWTTIGWILIGVDTFQRLKSSNTTYQKLLGILQSLFGYSSQLLTAQVFIQSRNLSLAGLLVLCGS